MRISAAPDHDSLHKHGWLRIIRNVLLVTIATLFAVWLVLFVTKGRFLKQSFERITSSMTERKVTVGGDFQLYFAPVHIKFFAQKLAISNPDWATKPELFSADRIKAHIAPLSLLFGTRHLYSLDLVNGAADLEWNARHITNTWTFSDAKGGKPLELPRVDVARVSGTTVRYLDPSLQLLTDLTIDPVTATNAKIGKAIGVQGTGKVRATPFRLTAQLLSPDTTVERKENKLALRVWAANSIIDVAGTLPGFADIEGVPLQVGAQGRNLAELLRVIDVTLPQTRRYTINARLVKDTGRYRFTRMRGTFGNSDLAGTLTVTNGDRLRLDATLVTKRLDIIDAAPFIGYNPDIVAIKGAVAAAAATGSGPQRLLPDAAFPIASMQHFDAGLKWTVAQVRSRNVPISDIGLTLALDRGRLALSPLTFTMARGSVASDIIFDTRRRPSFASYDIRLASTPMARLLAGYGVAEAGTTGTIRGRIKLEGRGDTIHNSLATSSGRIVFVMPRGTFWARNIQLSEFDIGTFAYKMFQGKLKQPATINCGVIGFTVRNGLAAADPILIDTSKNVMIGRGGFSFRDEAVDLAFRADSKKFSLFSGQSPVGIGGRFASPKLNIISPELIGRAGAAIGLAIVGTPVAGLLAFVDVGDAKSAACGPILAGANAASQRTTTGKQRKDVGNGRASTKK